MTVRKKLSKSKIDNSSEYPVYSAETSNNGIIGYVNNPEFICDKEKPIYINFGDHTRNFNIATKSFSVLDNVKVLLPKINNIRILQFIISAWKKQIPNLGYSRHWKLAKESIIPLPTKDGEIDFEFMENFIAELEAERIATLEAYLSAAGLKDFVLTDEEQAALERKNISYKLFNLKVLFGASTRGKRLKSDDRIQGQLPFVTAGETDEGISAYIGNAVNIFSKNTITIDMFGSAKYRNYNYGADDHIAVVHTEKISKFAAIFITAAIHKASHNGQFHYGRNFYAKDADELNISLPTKDGAPDYEYMEKFVSAVQKIVIADVVKYSKEKMSAYRQAAEKN